MNYKLLLICLLVMGALNGMMYLAAQSFKSPIVYSGLIRIATLSAVTFCLVILFAVGFSDELIAKVISKLGG